MKHLESETEKICDNVVDVAMRELLGQKYDEIQSIEDNPYFDNIYNYLQSKVFDAITNAPIDTETKINILMRHLHRGVEILSKGYVLLHIENDFSNAQVVKRVEYDENYGTFLRFGDDDFRYIYDLTEDEIEQLYKVLLILT